MNSNITSSNAGNINSKQNSFLTRTPLQNKINPNGSKTNLDNSFIKFQTEFKNKTETKPEKSDNNPTKEENDFIPPCKICIENNCNHERELEISIKEVVDLPRLPMEKHEDSETSSSPGSIHYCDEVFTFVNIFDIVKMDKLKTWIDEGLYFED